MAKKAGSYERIDGVEKLLHQTRAPGQEPAIVTARRSFVDEPVRDPIPNVPRETRKRRRPAADMTLTDEQSE